MSAKIPLDLTKVNSDLLEFKLMENRKNTTYQLLTTVNNFCFDRCITAFAEPSLTKEERQCLNSCYDGYIQGRAVTVKALTDRIAQHLPAATDEAHRAERTDPSNLPAPATQASTSTTQ
jgi:hypothetical protein